MKILSTIASILALGCIASAQTRVWENTLDQPTNSYGPSGSTAAAFGQPDKTSWTRWPERGPGIDFGSSQVLTEMTCNYLANTLDAMTGAENVTVQIYANDGAPITGSGGSTGLFAPNTLLFQSAPMKVYPGDQVVRIPLPNLVVPAKITWTLKFQGGNFDGAVGSFDPAAGFSRNVPGGRFWCAVPATKLQGSFGGIMYRRVFTAGGPSNWGAQDNPGVAGGFPGVFSFGGNFWSGDMSLLTTPYDNGTNLVSQAGFLGMSGPVVASTSSGSKAGNLITFNGPKRTVTSIDFSYYANTLASTGSPTYNLKLVKQQPALPWSGGQGGMPDLTQVLWDSGAQAIPLGQGGGGSGALQTKTFAVPNVVVPENFYWIMEVNGITGIGDDVVGPGILWSPKPGDTPNFFAGFDNPLAPGTWGQYVFPPANPPATFIYTTVAQLGPIKITAVAGSAAETLAPTAEQIVFGTTNSGGNLASWAADDNNGRKICRFFIPNAQIMTRMRLSYTTTKLAPTAISFNVKVSAHTPIVQLITLRVENKVTNLFVDTNVVLANIVDGSTYNGVPTGTLANYVGAGGAMRGEIDIRQTGISALSFPCTTFEFGQMVVTG